jgi:hypothetical protein
LASAAAAEVTEFLKSSCEAASWHDFIPTLTSAAAAMTVFFLSDPYEAAAGVAGGKK